MVCVALAAPALMIALSAFSTVKLVFRATLGLVMLSCCAGGFSAAAFLLDYRSWRMSYLMKLGATTGTMVLLALLCALPVIAGTALAGGIISYKLNMTVLLAPAPAIVGASSVALVSWLGMRARVSGHTTLRKASLPAPLFDTRFRALVAREAREVSLASQAAGTLVFSSLACAALAVGISPWIVCWVSCSLLSFASSLDAVKREWPDRMSGLSSRYALSDWSMIMPKIAITSACTAILLLILFFGALALQGPSMHLIIAVPFFFLCSIPVSISCVRVMMKTFGGPLAMALSCTAWLMAPLAAPVCLIDGLAFLWQRGRRA